MRSRLSRSFDDCSAWWAGYFTAGVKHLGLSGPDRTLSFSKTFDLLVLASYYVNTNLPPSVAITLIMSAHGTKLLLSAIQHGVFGLHVSDSWSKTRSEQTNETKVDVKIERVGWNDERAFQES